MSEYPKIIGVVTVQSNGGGVYELSADALIDTMKVRGEDKALATAEQVSNQIVAGLPLQIVSADEDQDDDVDELSPEDVLAALRARVAEMEAAGITVPVPNPHAAVDQQHRRNAVVPGRLAKKMTSEQKAALAAAGVKTTRIIIDQTDEIPPSGIFVGHNGRTFMLQAGVEIDCPDFVIDVLNDAIMTAAVTDPETHRVVGHRNRLRIPYRVVRD